MHMEEELSAFQNGPFLVSTLYTNEGEMLQSRTVREIQIASNFAVLKSSTSARNDSTSERSAKRLKGETTSTTDRADEQQQYELAIETAILVQKEIEQWENSIRELESMLTNPEEQQGYQSTNSLSDVARPSDSHDTNDTVIVAKDDNVPKFPNRLLLSSSTETRVAVIHEGDDGFGQVGETMLSPPFGISTTTFSSTSPSMSAQ